MRKKNILLAVLLNAWPLPLGLGYLYLGKWKSFLLFFLGLQVGAAVVVRAMTARTDLYGADLMFLLVVWVVSLADVYDKASRHNRLVEKSDGTV